MKVNTDPVQRRAHALLQEWGSGPVDYADLDRLRDHVDNDAGALTKPEIYSAAHAKWNSLDRAVRHVYQMSRELGVCLFDHYRDGYDEAECAQRAHTKRRAWRDRLFTARAAFLSAHDMLRAAPKKSTRERDTAS